MEYMLCRTLIMWCMTINLRSCVSKIGDKDIKKLINIYTYYIPMLPTQLLYWMLLNGNNISKNPHKKQSMFITWIAVIYFDELDVSILYLKFIALNIVEPINVQDDIIVDLFSSMSIMRQQSREYTRIVYLYCLLTLAKTVLMCQDIRDRKWNTITDWRCFFQHISCHHIISPIVLAH